MHLRCSRTPCWALATTTDSADHCRVHFDTGALAAFERFAQAYCCLMEVLFANLLSDGDWQKHVPWQAKPCSKSDSAVFIRVAAQGLHYAGAIDSPK